MASIKDAIEESIMEHNAAIKYILIAIPLFLFYNRTIAGTTDLGQMSTQIANFDGNNLGLYLFSSFLMFGLSLSCTHNVLNSQNQVLPSFNFFSLAFTAIKGLIALIPVAFIFMIIPSILIGFFAQHLDESLTQFIAFVISLLFYMGVISSYILYAKDYNIKEAYNFKLIFKSIVEVTLNVIFCGLMLGIANALITGFLIYAFWIFKLIGSPLFLFLMAFISVVNVAIFAHCLAQIGYEKIIVEENKDKII